MKILFITREISLFEPMGITQLSAMLKKEGHKCDFLICRLENSNFLKMVEKYIPSLMPVFAHFKEDDVDIEKINYDKLISEVKRRSPDMIAFSTTTGEHNHHRKLSKKIKDELGDVFSIFGGPHLTFFPEMAYEEGVDAICRGEGEYPLVELANRLEEGKDVTEIKNLWVNKNGQVYKNDVRPLIEDLDSLPFPDRELVYRYKSIRNFTNRHFITGRGCPFNCSYCHNHAYRSVYQGKGTIIRRRSVDNVIEEVKEVRSKYKMKKIQFEDDTFILHPEWIKEFSEKYKREVGIPFSCNVRANLVNDEIIRDIREAGCFSVTMGVESGNDYVRNQLLNRNMTREHITDACKILRKYGILINTNNIIGIPEETLENAFETLNINAECKVNHASAFLFQPFPRTKLGEYCKEKGYFDGDYDKLCVSFKYRSSLNLREKQKIENLQKFFSLGSSHPSMIPLIRELIKLPNNRLFDIINKIHCLKRAIQVKVG